MARKIKPISEQTIVITGATSGIGLATARLLAQHGARMVLAARDESALRELESEITSAGGVAIAVAADVGNESDVRHIADQTIERLGGFDTWINNAGVGIFGKLSDVSTDDAKRLFDTNFWGVVFGSTVAVEHFRTRDGGGALINVGSVVSDRAIPIQGIYSASKHAVKGYTDALRVELEQDRVAVTVTLIKPAAINTPFPQNAKNYLANEPALPPPVYAVGAVARAIARAIDYPQRDILVGGAGKMMSSMGKHAPSITDRVFKMMMRESAQENSIPVSPTRRDGLHQAGRSLHERGDFDGHEMKFSAYTQAVTHPRISGAVLGAIGAAAVAAIIGATETGQDLRKKARAD